MQFKKFGYDRLSNRELLCEQEWNIINMSGNFSLNVTKVTDQSQGEQEEDYYKVQI